MATETTAAGNESAFLYRLLVSPAFRWMRYLILVMVLGTISFNQVFIIFMDYRDILGVWIYVFTFIYMLTYVGVICLNLFWLFPKYLLKRHYMTYLSVLSVAMVIALLIQMVIEYLAYSHWPQLHARGSYFSVPMLMDYISSFMLSTLCMIGGTMTLLLKEWMIENQRVSQMEKAHVLSEVEQLKEQVSPELLFKTLHHSGELTLTEPEKASKMLMKLSQLLRYQLYDCSRQKVLLSSEIAFLTNYLTLEQSSLPAIPLSVYCGRGGKQDAGSSSALHSFCAAYHGVGARTANLASCLSGHSSESGEGYDCIHLYVSAT
ncbi:histidine kinase [Bacteroides thetaiotaomicron]|nr:histidine kinase [Bacteroides thetaiotaomicron]